MSELAMNTSTAEMTEGRSRACHETMDSSWKRGVANKRAPAAAAIKDCPFDVPSGTRLSLEGSIAGPLGTKRDRCADSGENFDRYGEVTLHLPDDLDRLYRRRTPLPARSGLRARRRD